MFPEQIQSGKNAKIIDEKGFTLIEVIVAVSIFAIGILAVGSMQISAVKNNRSALGSTRAITWATDRSERLMSLLYTDGDLTDGNYTLAQASDGVDNDSDGIIDETGESGDISISYTVVTNVTPPNTKSITFNANRLINGVPKTVITLIFTKAQNI